MSLVIKNGLVIDPASAMHAVSDVLIEGMRISAVGAALRGDEVFDAGGLVVLPGVIDAHVHLHLPGSAGSYRNLVETGVTTAIDFAGPVAGIGAELGSFGYGLNVACLEAVSSADTRGGGPDMDRKDADRYVERILRQGAIGAKLLCGHFPLSPAAIDHVLDAAAAHGIISAWHAGSTENPSNLNGMREAVALSKGRRFILPHINAYCRGKTADPYAELAEAFKMLRDNPHIIADSHLAVMNGTTGKCVDGKPADHVTLACLGFFGLPQSREGIRRGIQDSIITVILGSDEKVALLEGDAALEYYDKKDSDVWISFPVNIPGINAACLTERRKPGGSEFLIPLAITDGGYIPRNNLIGRLLHYWKLGYLSLDEAVRKCSLAPAEVYALKGKGRICAGADADITIIYPARCEAVRSYIAGALRMENGKALPHSGTLYITGRGKAAAENYGIPYRIID
jgi:cytosine/adenosine deaminase-related metal-dependent hydrolase